MIPMPVVFQQLLVLVWKDLLIDLRRKEHLLSMLLFAVLPLLVFQFAMGDDPQQFRTVLPGLIWVVFLMTGVLSLGKSLTQEMETGCMGALLMSPVDRSVLFLGKVVANACFLLTAQLLFLPLCAVFFQVTPDNLLGLTLVLVGGTLGFSSLGTLLTAMTASLRGREVLLPILLFPLMIPSLLSVVRLTAFLLFGVHEDEVFSWSQMLLASDILLGVVSLLAFEFVTEE